VDILRNERSGQPSTQQTERLQRADAPPYTTLGKDTEFQGTLKFKDGLRIEGRFNGDITSEGNLIVGKTGEVKAEITVGSITVEGKVNGNIVAQNLVELCSSAELRGDIKASKLKIDEGVVFVGKTDVQPNSNRKPRSTVAGKPSETKPGEKKGGGGQ